MNEQSSAPTSRPTRKSPQFDVSSQTVKIIAAVVVVLLVLGLGLYIKGLKDENKDLKANPEKAQAEEVDRVVDKVAKLIELPDGTPSLATVEDVSKLSDQPFFKDAKDGDFVLIFTEAKQAILFRESSNKIINVAPLAIDDPALTSTTAASVTTNTTDE